MENIQQINIAGFWIPAEVAFNPALAPIDKFLFSLIHILAVERPCDATNKTLSEILNVTPPTISMSVRNLKKYHYVILEYPNQKKRIIRINFLYSEIYKNIRLLKTKKDVNEFLVQKNFAFLNNTSNFLSIINNPISPKGDIDSFNKKESKRFASKTARTPLKTRKQIQKIKNHDLKSYSRQEQEIFLFWGSLGKPFSVHKKSQQPFIVAMKNIQKTLKTYSKQDIKRSIKTYHDLLISKDTGIRLKSLGHLVNLNEFFGFKKVTKDYMKDGNIALQVKSWFQECLPGKDPFLKFQKTKFMQDNYKPITKEIKRLWVQRALGGQKVIFKNQDENSFKRTSKRFVLWWQENSRHLDLPAHERRGPAPCVHYLFDALEFMNNGYKGVHPGWLYNDIMFDGNLPIYFQEQNISISAKPDFKSIKFIDF